MWWDEGLSCLFIVSFSWWRYQWCKHWSKEGLFTIGQYENFIYNAKFRGQINTRPRRSCDDHNFRSNSCDGWWCEKNNQKQSINKAFIGIRLCPSLATPLATYRYTAHYGPTWMASSVKPEVHDLAQRRQRRTEPQPQEICTENFVKIISAVEKICLRTDRHTYRKTDRNIPLSYQGGVISHSFNNRLETDK